MISASEARRRHRAKSRCTALIALALGLASAGCGRVELAYRYYLQSCPERGPVPQTDFPQVAMPIDLSAYGRRLRAIADSAEHLSLHVVSGEGRLAVYRVSIAAPSTETMAVLAGVHGNETGGVAAALALSERLVAEPPPWRVEILTPINPVGVAMLSRYDDNGCDLNRSVSRSTAPGIVLQREQLAEIAPDYVVSLHESPAAGFFVHPGEHVQASDLQAALAAVDPAQLATVDYWGQTLSTPGVSRPSALLRALAAAFALDSLDRLHNGASVPHITTESSYRASTPAARVTPHVEFVLALLASLSQ